MNTLIEVAAVCKATPASMTSAPMKRVGRRPQVSETMGVNGSAYVNVNLEA